MSRTSRICSPATRRSSATSSSTASTFPTAITFVYSHHTRPEFNIGKRRIRIPITTRDWHLQIVRHLQMAAETARLAPPRSRVSATGTSACSTASIFIATWITAWRFASSNARKK